MAQENTLSHKGLAKGTINLTLWSNILFFHMSLWGILLESEYLVCNVSCYFSVLTCVLGETVQFPTRSGARLWDH